jgi:hypothetical protein
MPPIQLGMWSENWQTLSGHEVHRTLDVKGVGTPQKSRSDFTGVTVPWISPSSVGGRGAELGAGGRGG